MTPTAAYKRINKLIWYGRLPVAVIKVVPDATIPTCYGITFHDDLVVRPVILLNATVNRWGKTLIHEMLHVAEPRLQHGKIFEGFVERYWNIARKKIKGLK
jgi:hypothetical protein